MSESDFPKGWDESRVRRLIHHYEAMSDEEIAAEDEDAMKDRDGQTVIAVPDELLPAIRQLIADHETA
jgi:hypothetical protein